jgi:hypothetical protein
LQYGIGVEPSDTAALAGGKRHHAWQTLCERLAGAVTLLTESIRVVMEARTAHGVCLNRINGS